MNPQSTEDTEMSVVPRIGDIVHYYPNNKTRNAAVVCNVLPLKRDDNTEIERPSLSLRVFDAEGNSSFRRDVPPVDPEDDEAQSSGCWSFKDEIATLQKDEEDSEDQEGVHSNIHVGNI